MKRCSKTTAKFGNNKNNMLLFLLYLYLLAISPPVCRGWTMPPSHGSGIRIEQTRRRREAISASLLYMRPDPMGAFPDPTTNNNNNNRGGGGTNHYDHPKPSSSSSSSYNNNNNNENNNRRSYTSPLSPPPTSSSSSTTSDTSRTARRATTPGGGFRPDHEPLGSPFYNSGAGSNSSSRGATASASYTHSRRPPQPPFPPPHAEPHSRNPYQPRRGNTGSGADSGPPPPRPDFATQQQPPSPPLLEEPPWIPFVPPGTRPNDMAMPPPGPPPPMGRHDSRGSPPPPPQQQQQQRRTNNLDPNNMMQPDPKPSKLSSSSSSSSSSSQPPVDLEQQNNNNNNRPANMYDMRNNNNNNASPMRQPSTYSYAGNPSASRGGGGGGNHRPDGPSPSSSSSTTSTPPSTTTTSTSSSFSSNGNMPPPRGDPSRPLHGPSSSTTTTRRPPPSPPLSNAPPYMVDNTNNVMSRGRQQPPMPNNNNNNNNNNPMGSINNNNNNNMGVAPQPPSFTMGNMYAPQQQQHPFQPDPNDRRMNNAMLPTTTPPSYNNDNNNYTNNTNNNNMNGRLDHEMDRRRRQQQQQQGRPPFPPGQGFSKEEDGFRGQDAFSTRQQDTTTPWSSSSTNHQQVNSFGYGTRNIPGPPSRSSSNNSSSNNRNPAAHQGGFGQQQSYSQQQQQQQGGPYTRTAMSPQSNLPPDAYELAVVGAGVVGVQAALTAAANGRRVVLVDAPAACGALMSPENEDLSVGAPTGLFSKALRDTSKRIQVRTLRGMGLREDSVWNEIISSCLDLARNSAQDMERQLDEAGVDRVQGYASFSSATGDCHSLEVRKSLQPHANVRTIQAGRILLATGSAPFRPPGIPFDTGNRILDSDSINRLSFLPRSIAITGSGIIAVEFAKIFRNLGASVTLIIRDEVPRKALEKIGLDKDVAATLVADLVRSGIRIERDAQVGKFTVPDNPRTPLTIELKAKGGGPRKNGLRKEIKCNAYLAAVGRKPNTKSLNLDAVGIQVDEYGGILVDQNLCTTAPNGNIFAAGDVLGRPFLASTGTAQGQASVLSMFPPQSRDQYSNFQCDPNDPSCVADGVARSGIAFDPASLAANPFAFPTGIWSSPEAAYYGFTKPQAIERGINAEESMALYAECLRGRVFSPNGLLKLVFDKTTGKIVGIHICGDDACELIHYGMELVKAGRTIQDLRNSLYSAVTFHEMYKIAAQNALDEKGARKRRAAAGKAVAARQRARVASDDYD